MNIQKVTHGNELIVTVEGKIDTITAPELGSFVFDELDDNDDIYNLTLDFTDVEYISSMGLRVILELQKKITPRGEIQIINVKDNVMDVFDMTGFSKFIHVELCSKH